MSVNVLENIKKIKKMEERSGMEQRVYDEYIKILKEELVTATGCTEPIAIAYGATLAVEALGELPEKVEVWASANIIKNVKSVVVPCTGGKRGIKAAVCAGVVADNANAELEILQNLTGRQKEEINHLLDTLEVGVEESETDYIFDIQIKAIAGAHSGSSHIAGYHTNVICVKRDEQILREKEYVEKEQNYETDRNLLTVEKIVEFAACVEDEEIFTLLKRQISCNTTIAEEGLNGEWGAQVGKVLLRAYGNGVHNRAKAMAAAGSDARMNGCELPVVINSGSGNQGMTASLPVIVYGKELGISDKELLRALVVSNLVTIHLKTGIGRLSAYCGAISAGCGAGAGITYLYGGRAYEISHTIVNAIAINSGVVCDGAKASCAAKIASAVEAGLLGLQMQKMKTQFYDGEGLVQKGVENTIKNIGELARKGMRQTDKTIIDIMTRKGTNSEY